MSIIECPLTESITDFWGFRWHQRFRHVFVAFGSRPCLALVCQPGELMGAFAVSGLMRDAEARVWGLGREKEFRTVGGFFHLMESCVGAASEHGFKQATVVCD
ncbi:hypothetical protein BGY98DRAFT_934871 [Russula aff. rugulosa BPL654]|nr:hypothetical protein BGY98DRAFT_934871 [Russula aff. rugulosa BPL654]